MGGIGTHIALDDDHVFVSLRGVHGQVSKLQAVVAKVAAVPAVKTYYTEKAANNKIFSQHAGL